MSALTFSLPIRLTTTINANGGLHTELLEGTTHLARRDDKGRAWVRGFGGTQVLLRPNEFSEEKSTGL